MDFFYASGIIFFYLLSALEILSVPPLAPEATVTTYGFSRKSPFAPRK